MATWNRSRNYLQTSVATTRETPRIFLETESSRYLRQAGSAISAGISTFGADPLQVIRFSTRVDWSYAKAPHRPDRRTSCESRTRLVRPRAYSRGRGHVGRRAFSGRVGLWFRR